MRETTRNMKTLIAADMLVIRFLVSHIDSASPAVLLLEGTTNISCDMAEIPRLSSSGSRFLLVPFLLSTSGRDSHERDRDKRISCWRASAATARDGGYLVNDLDACAMMTSSGRSSGSFSELDDGGSGVERQEGVRGEEGVEEPESLVGVADVVGEPSEKPTQRKLRANSVLAQSLREDAVISFDEVDEQRERVVGYAQVLAHGLLQEQLHDSEDHLLRHLHVVKRMQDDRG
mmetsp:Transcript_13390/g.46704  ORF Transcript_13390/g.46704 Transcript_13390/m.46704 type:complete len:232 (-) Transcript_13390:284-979(-)